MLKNSKAFSGFSVRDTQESKKFYADVLGLEVIENNEMGETLLTIKTGGGNNVLAYPKPDHQPATFTILNFPVDDIDQVVDELISKGVHFEKYDDAHLKTDEKGIMRSDQMSIAWFTDPSGNILSVIQEKAT